MDVASLLQWIVNGGIAVVVIILILHGDLVPGWAYRKLEKAYKDRGTALEKVNAALDVERQRNADMQVMVAVGTRAITAVAQVAEEQRRIYHTPPHGMQQLPEAPP